MKPVVSVDEYVAVLKHSSLPTVVVEGDDDMVVYRFIEKRFGATGISVLPVHGRENVIAIFRRRSEIASPVFFIADRDNWCITGVPLEFLNGQMTLTKGYSIENDAVSDGDFLGLMTDGEKQAFERELHIFADWYALALSRHLQDPEKPYKTHPNAILDDVDNRRRLLALQENEAYPYELRSRIEADLFDLVRGKSLLAIVMRHLSYPGRAARHHHLTLLETVGAKPGPRVGSIFDSVADFFALTPEVSFSL